MILQGGNALTCAICIDLVTDIDEFLTSDTTEDQIVQFVEQVFMSSHFNLYSRHLLDLLNLNLNLNFRMKTISSFSCARHLVQFFPTLR